MLVSNEAACEATAVKAEAFVWDVPWLSPHPESYVWTMLWMHQASEHGFILQATLSATSGSQHKASC